MAWIELHQTLPKNKKTLRLKNILNIKTPQAVGHLCMIWLWALDNAQEGDLSGFTADEIAEVAEWPGRNPDMFVKALIEAGFIDEDMHIHDWLQYAGKLVEQREIQREQARLRQQKRREKAAKLKECHADVTRDKSVSHADVTHVPYPTVPYPTVPIENVVVGGVESRTRAGEAEHDGGAGEDPPDEPRKSFQFSPCVQKAVSAYMDKFGGIPPSMVVEGIKDYSETMEADAIIRAFDVALAEGNRKWSYIKGILDRYKNDGVKTLADVLRLEVEYEERKQNKGGTNGQSISKNSEGSGRPKRNLPGVTKL